MANYRRQDFKPVIGTSTTPITLTASYTDDDPDNSGIVHIGGAENVVLLIAYAMGASETSNTIQLKYELTGDYENFYRVTNTTFSGGTGTVSLREDTFSATAAAEAYNYFVVELIDVNAKGLKIWAKETGIAANGGTLYVTAMVAGR